MKIRIGFVSNSSSSSFMITGNITEDTLKITIDLTEFGILIKNKEDLQKYLEEDRYYIPESAREIVENGGIVLVGLIDNKLEGLEKYLPKSVKFLNEYEMDGWKWL